MFGESIFGFFSLHLALTAGSVTLATLTIGGAWRFARQLATVQGPARARALAGGTAAVGAGLLATYLLALQASSLPQGLQYGGMNILCAVCGATLVAGTVLVLAAHDRPGRPHRLGGGAALALGVFMLQDFGRFAMRVPMPENGTAVAALLGSVATGLLGTALAAWLAARFRAATRAGEPGREALWGLGAAVAGLHFTMILGAALTEMLARHDAGIALGPVPTAAGVLVLIALTLASGYAATVRGGARLTSSAAAHRRLLADRDR